MSPELNVDERCAVQDYERVSTEASYEAQSLRLAAIALEALADPSNQSRARIFSDILRHLDDESRPGDLQLALWAAAKVVKEHADGSSRIAAGASETAEQIGCTGLREAD